MIESTAYGAMTRVPGPHAGWLETHLDIVTYKNSASSYRALAIRRINRTKEGSCIGAGKVFDGTRTRSGPTP